MRKTSSKNLETRGLSVKDLESFKGGCVQVALSALFFGTVGIVAYHLANRK